MPTKERESGLPPIAGNDPRVLILGSFPSRMSLDAGLYYANPRNQFWQIMRTILDISTTEEILKMYTRLKNHNIALWDMVESREYQYGSMDHDIRGAKINDIPGFLDENPTIRFIGVNGGKAWSFFRRILPPALPDHLTSRRLPSTSPANARYSLDEKVREWRIILDYLY